MLQGKTSKPNPWQCTPTAHQPHFHGKPAWEKIRASQSLPLTLFLRRHSSSHQLLDIPQHQRAMQLFPVMQTGGSARNIRSLSPLPSLLGGNRALPGFGLHKTATQKQSKDSDYLNQLGWGQTAALNCKSTCEMWALHCLQAEEKAKEALKGCSAHNPWDKGKEGKEGKEGKPQYPCPALGHTAQLTTCLFQQFLPWLPHCYQQDSLQVKGGEFKFTQIRIRIW